MATCLEALRLFGGVPLPPTGPLWAEACVHASDAINVSARMSDKPGVLSPYQKLYGRHRSRDCSHSSSLAFTM